VFCNRGTSGIDGTISTYIGATTQQSEISYLLLGDLSFMYDRNGLWNQYLDKNQRIVVINNAGGGIFRNLEGAKDLPELEGYIATHQQKTAEKTALDAGLVYLSATNETELEQNLNMLSKSSNAPILLEIFTDPAVNQRVLAEYMGLFKS
jgi:2-succinyl-5-enolpyruvyl-6-hydroxy-3-cyclohexene-1-carboxylate synthase